MGKLAAIALFACVFLASCQSDLNVEINLRDDGTGSVNFSIAMDYGTVAKYPQLLHSFNTQDLREGNWHIVDTATENHLAASKDFFTGSQIQMLLDEISPGSFELKEIERSRESGRNKVKMKGTIYPNIFRNNLLGGTDIDISKLPEDAAAIFFTLKLGDGGSISEKTWVVPLKSDEPQEFSLTHQLGGDRNRLWRWISIAAFSLLGLALLLNLAGWLYLRKNKQKGMSYRQWIKLLGTKAKKLPGILRGILKGVLKGVLRPLLRRKSKTKKTSQIGSPQED